jgi:CHAD domain-containing protein
MSNPAAFTDRHGARLRVAGAGSAAPPTLTERKVGHRASVDELVRAGLTTGAKALFDHEPVIRSDDDPEGVHQARIGIRRMRSVLHVFRTELEPGWADALDDDLARLGRVLGAVRDADVLGQRLAAMIDALPVATDRVAGVALLSRLGVERRRHLTSLRRELDGSRHRELVVRLLDAVDAPVFVADDVAAMPAAPIARARIKPPWRRLQRAVRALPEGDPPIEALHAVRLRAKRVRYTCDAIVPVVGRPARELAGAMRPVQDLLGDLHDTATADAWLRAAAAASSLPRAAVLIAGELVVLDQLEAARLRAAWPAAWAGVPHKLGWT